MAPNEWKAIVQEELGQLVDRLIRRKVELPPAEDLAARLERDGTAAALFLGSAKARLLTEHERKVAVLIGHGLGNAGIARKLGCKSTTVAHHITSINRKLGTTSRAGIARFAARFLDEGVINSK